MLNEKKAKKIANELIEIYSSNEKLQQDFIKFTVEQGQNEILQNFNQNIEHIRNLWNNADETAKKDFNAKRLYDMGVITLEEAEPYIEIQYVEAYRLWEEAKEEERLDMNLEYLLNIDVITKSIYEKYKAKKAVKNA